MRTKQTHEEILKDPKVRYLGKLDGYAVYKAEDGYRPPGNGATIFVRDLTRETWRKVIKEMNGPNRVDHDSIFLELYQADDFLKWAGDLLLKSSEEARTGQAPCTDCKDGWYVGIVERRLCPTCNGTKVVPA